MLQERKGTLFISFLAFLFFSLLLLWSFDDKLAMVLQETHERTNVTSDLRLSDSLARLARWLCKTC